MDQQHYVGLDVSLETTSVYVINQSGAVVWRGKCSTEPEAISQAVRAHAPAALRVGLDGANVQLADPATAETRPARRLP
jgi:transposase